MKRAFPIALGILTLVTASPALAQRDDDRDHGRYDAALHLGDGAQYRPRLLAADERVYRGRDGRYYCRHADGTTGRIVGAVDDDALGNAMDSGHSRTTRTLIAGYIARIQGQAYDRHNHEIRCR